MTIKQSIFTVRIPGALNLQLTVNSFDHVELSLYYVHHHIPYKSICIIFYFHTTKQKKEVKTCFQCALNSLE